MLTGIHLHNAFALVSFCAQYRQRATEASSEPWLLPLPLLILMDGISKFIERSGTRIEVCFVCFHYVHKGARITSYRSRVTSVQHQIKIPFGYTYCVV